MLLGETLDAVSRTDEAIAELEPIASTARNEPLLHFELGYLYF